MTQSRSLNISKKLMLCALIAVGASDAALAQGAPPSAAANPVCQRLTAQLSTIDGGGDRADQIRRYEESSARQQSELDRVQAQAKRQGCDGSGLFSLFGGQSAQCGPINNQIQQMRANLDQITTSLERLRGGGNAERDNQRRSVLLALAQNNCGAQYANAARGGGNFFDNLFGGNVSSGGDNGAAAGTYRTVCARTCDGFYFPVSFATTPGRFADDEKTCKALCPNSEATLFTYRNPGEDMNQAVSLQGAPYSASPNAFKYRQAFDKACSCKAPGQTWSEALKSVDDRNSLQQGDIIVTDENAKKMAQPPQQRGATQSQKKGSPVAPADPAPTASNAPADAPAGDKPIRSVGPTFIQTR